jgi:hypothetical protein
MRKSSKSSKIFKKSTGQNISKPGTQSSSSMIPRSRAIAKIPTNRTMAFVNRLLKHSEIRTMLVIKEIGVGRISG